MDGAEERARLHFQSGASYYESGSYEDALREFRRAYELSGRPELLYNISVCYQQLGQLEPAIAHLRRYLDEVEEIPNRANLELRAENLQRRLDRERAESDAHVEGSPEPEPEAEGETEPSAAREPITPPPPEGASSDPNVGAIVGFSVAAVGVIMAGVFGGLTLAEDSSLGDSCSPACSAEQVSTLQTFALVTDIGFGVALAGAAVGALLLLVGSDGGSEQAQVYPWMNESSGGLALGGNFR